MTRLHRLLLIILAALAVVVLADGVVSAAPPRQAMDDPTLSSLSLSGGALDPAFDPNAKGFDATMAYNDEETTVTATPTNPNATVFIQYEDDGGGTTVSLDGVVPLGFGNTFIYLTVTAEDGEAEQSYEIKVTRPRYIATRSFRTSTVAPGGTVAVTITYGDYGSLGGQTLETLPAGFSWVFESSDDLPHGITAVLDPNNSQILDITMVGVVDKYRYEVTVADTVTPGVYTFSGTISRDNEPDLHDILGDTEVTVTLPPGVTVSPTDLTVDEGGTGTYTVVLNTQPTADVTVTVNDPTDNTEVTADPATLTFTTSNWATARTVTVSAAEDGDPMEDTATVTHTVSGGDYATITAPDVTVTVTDNDTRGVTVSPTSLQVGEGSTNTPYTVVLDTLPTGNVTVGISSDNTDVTVSSPNLTFTTTDWNTAQMVTVTAGEDADAAVDMATLTHNPSGADYGSVDDTDLDVTVTDDDTAGVTVSATSLPVTEGSTNTYTVVLDTQPTSGVTVAIDSNNPDVTADPTRLTFTTSNWATAQTVTVSAAPDDDTLADMAMVTHTVTGGDYAGLSASSVTVRVTDNSIPGITFSPMALGITEGGMREYSVTLDTIPTSTVTVRITSSLSADATPFPSTLTFMASNWNVPQMVTVTAVDDEIDEDAETAILTHTANGGGYGSVTGSVTVTLTDNDTRGVTVSPTSLTVNEGGTGIYTVVLVTQPTSSVTVTVNDPTNTDVTADPANLMFTTSNWATEQTVTVRASEDADASQDTAMVTHTVAGGDYGTTTAQNVDVTVTDNDTPGLTFSPTSLTVDESSTGTYTVRLNTQPSGDVMVAISSDNTDVTVSLPILMFTTTDWDTEQTITVTAGEDADAAVDMATLTHNPSGADYNSVSNASLSVTVTDDEMAGVTVSKSSLMLTEGGNDTYTIVLDTEPTATVTIGVADNSAEVSLSDSTLTFTTSNWSTAQMVTVTSMADDVDEGTETATVRHTVNGGDYTGLTADDVTVTVTDDDTRGVTVSEPSLTIEEGDRSTYTVVLKSAPTANVTVTVSSNTMGVTVSPTSLMFTAGNWSSAKTVTVSTTEDRIDEADQTAAVTHVVSGGDYGSVTVTGVTVTVTDDDTRGLTFSVMSLPIAEGRTGRYTVKLDSQPTAEVTVGISSDIADVSVDPATLTFTTGNWATPQTVTATANEDDIDKDAGVMATLKNEASGGDYGSVSGSVSVPVTDNDMRGVMVSKSSLMIEEGGSDTYTVALTSAPTSDVTVEVSSDTTGVTVPRPV